MFALDPTQIFPQKFWIQTLFLSPSEWRVWIGPWTLLLTCISPFLKSNLVSISFYYLVLGPPCPSAYIYHPWGYYHLVLLLWAHEFQWRTREQKQVVTLCINLYAPPFVQARGWGFSWFAVTVHSNWICCLTPNHVWWCSVDDEIMGRVCFATWGPLVFMVISCHLVDH
jgi:hypothetical protein